MVALKVIPIEDDIGVEELMKEIDVLKICRDDFVVDYFEHYEIHRRVWIGKLLIFLFARYIRGKVVKKLDINISVFRLICSAFTGFI